MEILGLIDIPIWLFCVLDIVAVISLYTIYMCWDYGIFEKMRVKHPKPTPIMGNFATMRKKGIVDSQRDYYYQFDKIWGLFETRYPVLYIGKPELIKDIFVKEFSHFVNRRSFDILDEPMDNILMVMKDQQWRHVRNVITPTFSGKKLREMTELINGAADRLMENLKPKVDNDEHIEIKEIFEGFAMDVISSTAFGIQVDSQKNPKDPFVVAAKQVLDTSSFAFKYAMFVVFFCPFLMPVLKLLRLPRGFPKSLTNFFKNVTDAALADRRAHPSNHVDFLELMVQAEKEAADSQTNGEHSANRKGLTEKEILAQALIFFLAGYNTTSSTLSFTMYQLSVNPDCLQKAVQEVDEVLGDDLPDYESVKELNYIEMCINESLRLFTAVARVDRVANDDVVIGGIHIPKGMCVVIPISAIHRDPDYWPEPEKFNPERFTAAETAKRDPFVYMPFGHGPRHCIGMRLALLETKIAIARILQKFYMYKSDKTKEPVKPNKMGQLKVEGGLWVKMRNRNKN